MIKVYLRPRPRLKNPVFEFDFAELAIKGRGAMGNILTKFSVQKIVMKEKGVSTLGGRKIWFDQDVMRLNVDARGVFLGEFSGEDLILVITRSGQFRTTGFDLSSHFEDDLLLIEKYRESKIWSAAYYDGEQEYYYVKRFRIEPTAKSTRFIGEHPESRLIRITEVEYPRLELKFGGKNRDRTPEIIEVADFIGVKSFRARGKRLSNYEVKVIEELEPMEVQATEGHLEDPEQEIPVASAPEKEVPEKEVPEKTAAEQKVAEKKATKKKTPKDPDAAPPQTTAGQETGKAAGKGTAKGGGKARSSGQAAAQDPDEVPLEIVKPKEEKGDPAKGKKDKPNGQFTLEW